jgi:hypothetical protein
MMGRLNGRRAFVAFVLATVAFVAVASVVDAIRERSWGPVAQVAWLPAVLVAAFSPGSSKSCRRRLRAR